MRALATGSSALAVLCTILLTPSLGIGAGFIENRGQVDSRVSYYAPGVRVAVYFVGDAVVLDLKEPAPVGEPGGGSRDPRYHGHRHDGPRGDDRARRGCAIYVRMVGARPSVRVEARGETSARYNYFLGKDPAKWRSEVPAYGEVVYRDVWPGMDLVFREEDGAVAYEAIARPGADMGALAFGYDGAEKLLVEDGGIERLETPVGSLIHEHSGLSGKLRWEEPRRGAGPGERPKSMNNPRALLWSTFLGGGGYDYGEAVALDASGNGVLTGRTDSGDFPTTPGAYSTSYDNAGDVFVTKISSSGDVLLWSTFLGGYDLDAGYALALDASGNVVVTGLTDSGDFPTTPGAYDEAISFPDDVFVSKISSSGSALLWSTFLGGTSWDEAYGVVLDASRDVVVTGWTESTDFPAFGAYDSSPNGMEDVFVSKLSSEGDDLVWSTFLGGIDTDRAAALAIDALGNVVVTGWTRSFDFPATPGAYDISLNGDQADVFVSKLSTWGEELLWSTFLGGSNNGDGACALALDTLQNVVVAGYTGSTDFPTTPGAYDTSFNGNTDAFVAKLWSSADELVWSTFLGGSNSGDAVYGLALDTLQNVVVAGGTGSSDFPTTPGAYDASFNGAGDVFVAKVCSSGSGLLWSTFLGGSSGDGGIDLALDTAGRAVVTGCTGSSDFPTTPGACDTSFQAGYDGLVTKLDVSSHVWHINPAGTGDAPTIQAGIDSAASGDTVLVADGTYTGAGNRDLDFGGKSLILASENGPELTVIDCLASGRGMYFHSGESLAAQVRGFTIKNGYVSGAPGGGVYIENSSPAFANCLLSGNLAREGAGVFVGSRAAPAFSGCSILANEALPGGNGGGGVMADSSSASFTDCAITGNRTVDAPGGGVQCRRSASPTFTRCCITQNSAPTGGGVSVTSGSTPAFVGCTVSGNEAGDEGGGLYANDSYSSWEKAILWGNVAPAGGEAWLEGSQDTISFWCSVVDSSRLAVGVGAEVFYQGSDLFIDPLFCRPACSCCTDTSALFALAVNSPCLPVNSPCGELIGCEGQGCGSVLVWVGSGDGESWGDPYNWNEGRIPQAGDHVQITRGVGDHVRLTQAATIAELTLCGRGLVADTLEIAKNGHLEVPKIRTTEEILLTEGEALGRGDAGFMVPGQLVVQPDTLHNLPEGRVTLEVGSIAGSGTLINYNGAHFTKSGIATGEVALDFQNGGRGAASDTAKVEVVAGTLILSDSLANEAMLTVEAGAVLEVRDGGCNLGSGVFRLRGSLAGSGSVENHGSIQKTGWDTSSVTVTLRNLRDVAEAWVGDVEVLEGMLVLQGLLENEANLTVEPGTTLDVQDRVSNLAAGVFDLKGTSRGSGTIDNLGLFRKTGAGLSSVTAGLNNLLDTGGGGGARGRIEVNQDTLAVAALDNHGIVSIAASATLAVSDSLTNRVNAALEGSGTLDVSGAGFANDGIVSPGLSPGTLQVTGGFIQSPASEITIEIGGRVPGTEYDVLRISGAASLDGALHVFYVNGFSPSVGDTFEIIQWEGASPSQGGSRSGDGFSCLSGLQTPGGHLLEPVGLPDAFLLVTVDSTSANHPPTAQADNASTDSFTPLVLWLVNNDTDPDAGDVLSIVSVSTAGTSGEVFVNAGDTTVTYVPPFVFGGMDTFTYYVTDCRGGVDSALVTIAVTDVSAVEELEQRAPARPMLHPNFPNPFNPVTTIQFDMSHAGTMDLAIYDVQGRRVRTLASGYHQPGRFTATWLGTDDEGRDLAAGVYFVRLQAPGYVATGKLVLAK